MIERGNSRVVTTIGKFSLFLQTVQLTLTGWVSMGASTSPKGQLGKGVCIHTGACSWHLPHSGHSNLEEAGGSFSTRTKGQGGRDIFIKGIQVPGWPHSKELQSPDKHSRVLAESLPGRGKGQEAVFFRKYTSSLGWRTGHLQPAEVTMSQTGSCQCHAKSKEGLCRPQTRSPYPTWTPCGGLPSVFQP